MTNRHTLNSLWILAIFLHCVTEYANGISPVSGKKITTPFGKKGSWAAGYHTGVDYACSVGTKIVATRTGVVKAGSWSAAYGTHIILQSKGLKGETVQHLYAHLSQKLVKTGVHVTAGQEIGKSGNTGRTTGPHLHYEERVSPYDYMNHRKPQFN